MVIGIFLDVPLLASHSHVNQAEIRAFVLGLDGHDMLIVLRPCF